MKYLLIGDIHGAQFSYLMKVSNSIKPDVIICTGDFDTPESIKEFMKFESQFIREGKTIIKIPGNHDHSILNGMLIYSKRLKDIGKTSWDLSEEFSNSPKLKRYLKELVYYDNCEIKDELSLPIDSHKYGDQFKTIIIHGALDGNLPYGSEFTEREKKLWYRLKDSGDYRLNFKKMGERDYSIMIRGHDHEQTIATQNKYQTVSIIHPSSTKSTFLLQPHLRYVLNPGSYYKGAFAIIDTKWMIPTITFYSNFQFKRNH